jgi:hypothetical protein
MKVPRKYGSAFGVLPSPIISKFTTAATRSRPASFPKSLTRSFAVLASNSRRNAAPASSHGAVHRPRNRQIARWENDVTSSAQEDTSFTSRLPREAAPKVGQPILDLEDIDKT